jgi:hypothetical protein
VWGGAGELGRLRRKRGDARDERGVFVVVRRGGLVSGRANCLKGFYRDFIRVEDWVALGILGFFYAISCYLDVMLSLPPRCGR